MVAIFLFVTFLVGASAYGSNGAFYHSRIASVKEIQSLYKKAVSRKSSLSMAGFNSASDKQRRDVRRAGADDRIVELRKPMGLTLDENEDGDVYVVDIEKNGRADKSGMVFVGDRVNLVSATFGEDMWSCRNAGLTRVMSCIKVRNTKPVRLVLEHPDPKEEQKRRDIAFRELSVAEKKMEEEKAAALLEAMGEDDKKLLKKRKGPFGLW